MSAGLPICGYALVGPGAEHAPEHRIVDVPPPGTKRRGGRLPLLATELAKRALQGGDTDERTSVIFGSGLGCLTETQLFVEHMIAAAEATPKPRAFSSSVHNAIGSKVALDLAARGECQTFVQAEVSFPHALFAAARVRERHPTAPILVGAVDESCEYVERGLDACGKVTVTGEGGAVLLCDPTRPPLAHVSLTAMGRSRTPTRWAAAQDLGSAALVAVPALGVATNSPALTGVHPSLTASFAALAIGILTGEMTPAAFALQEPPSAIALLSRTRFGDCALTHITPAS